MIKKILETRSMISPVRAHRISALRHPHARAHTEMVDKDTSDPKHTNRLAGCHMRVSGPQSLAAAAAAAAAGSSEQARRRADRQK